MNRDSEQPLQTED
jgi:hypothetical protein